MNDNFPQLSQNSIVKKDFRGSLEVLYENNNIVLKRSFSHKGVFRGMHLQTQPHEQIKLIRVISGKIIDFLVDPKDLIKEISWREIDAGSDWIKIGSNFSHGFYALEDTVFEYICDGGYNEETEQSYSITEFLREVMNIKDPILSEKDKNSPQLFVTSSQDVC
jgi:dTDP-4-dehydrorhamnose 3,5-epimerase